MKRRKRNSPSILERFESTCGWCGRTIPAGTTVYGGSGKFRSGVDLSHKAGVGKLADFCPSWHGGKNWEPGAYNPKTRMVYIPAQENICAVMRKLIHLAYGVLKTGKPFDPEWTKIA